MTPIVRMAGLLALLLSPTLAACARDAPDPRQPANPAPPDSAPTSTNPTSADPAAATPASPTPPAPGAAVNPGTATTPCVFRFALPEPPGSIDPAFARSGLENLIAPNLFEGLMNYPETDGPPVPGAAERYEVSPDGLTYTFHLRPDARWSDGQPVTAADFAYAWRRVLTPATGAPYADILYIIAGAEDFHAGRATDPETVRIETPDPRTLRVHLRHPAPYLPELTAFFTWLPVPRQAIEAHGDRWTRPENIITNGPYHLTADDFGARMILTKRPDTWDAPRIGADRIEIRFVNDGSTVANLVETGELDWTGHVDLPSVRLPILRRTPLFRADPWMATHYLRLNTTAPPFDDPRVRRAIALALDRESLATMLRDGSHPAAGFVPPMPDWKPPTPPDFDPDRARTLLSTAGYGPQNPLVLRLHFPNDELRRLLAQLIAAQLTKHLDARIETWTEEFKVYLGTQDRMNYQMSLSRWAADYADPSSFIEMWVGGSLQNKTGWSDPEYDRLVQQAQRNPDPQARRALFATAEARVLDQAPIVPLVYGSKAMLLRPGFRGLGVNTLGNHLMKHIACER